MKAKDWTEAEDKAQSSALGHWAVGDWAVGQGQQAVGHWAV